MGSNRTVIPGMDGTKGLDSPTHAGVEDSIVPILADAEPQVGPQVVVDTPGALPTMPAPADTPVGSPTPAATPQRPLLGFLYSVSRAAAGEYWPLYAGPNTIGSGPQCDVRLQEGTVSPEHAVLMIRQMKNPQKVIASLTDERSVSGTMINGMSLDFSPNECHGGDIITVGDHYQLYLVLIDPDALGIAPCADFVDTAASVAVNSFPVFSGNNPYQAPKSRNANRTRAYNSAADKAPDDGFTLGLNDAASVLPPDTKDHSRNDTDTPLGRTMFM